MFRSTLILLLTIAVAGIADEPRQLIQTAEQAVVRFREVRDSDLKTLLTELQLKRVVATSNAVYLTVRRMQPRDYKPPYRDDRWRIFGTLAAAAECKNDTWILAYDTPTAGGMMVYLDAVTGKVLYIYNAPEG